MKYIISGTNRPGSKSLALAQIIQSLYREAGESVGIIDLAKITIPLAEGSVKYSGPYAGSLQTTIDQVNASSGLILVVPEYNGSFPGVLKLFIDHWSYPQSFEFRPVCYVGLGGRFGGLRPVEHLQQVFGYRNAFSYPDRIFLMNIHNTLKDGRLEDEFAMKLLRQQVDGFRKFVEALDAAGLSALRRSK